MGTITVTYEISADSTEEKVRFLDRLIEAARSLRATLVPDYVEDLMARMQTPEGKAAAEAALKASADLGGAAMNRLTPGEREIRAALSRRVVYGGDPSLADASGEWVDLHSALRAVEAMRTDRHQTVLVADLAEARECLRTMLGWHAIARTGVPLTEYESKDCERARRALGEEKP